LPATLKVTPRSRRGPWLPWRGDRSQAGTGLLPGSQSRPRDGADRGGRGARPGTAHQRHAEL